MAKAYYGSRFSENMTRTPEGYLICHNVPIARTGWQDYLDSEIGAPNATGKMVKVYRSEDEVFNPAVSASFELKSVCDDHPTVDVASDNYSSHEKGQVTNVRRGTGEHSDLLMADMVVKDPNLISKIENGKREVSCGYNCVYEPIEGGYAQKQIRGNHVAVVQSGRAGPRVKIKDSKIERSNKMPKISDAILKAIGWKQFVQDASPEEVAEAMEAKKEEKPAEKETKDEGGDEMLSTLKAILARLEKLEAAEAAEAKPAEDALDALEKEIGDPGAGGESEEESVTVPAENMETADEFPDEKEKSKATDSNHALKQRVALARAIIVGLPVAEQAAAKQRAADALRKEMPAKPEGNAYKDMLKRKASDAKPEHDPTAYGKNCAKANPHYKGDK